MRNGRNPMVALLSYVVLKGLESTVVRALQLHGARHPVDGLNPISACNLFFFALAVVGLSLAALGFIPGALMPLWLYAVAAQATSLPIAMTLERAITVFVLTLAMCLASGAIATRRLQAADPAELF